jgi:hypothetical protein
MAGQTNTDIYFAHRQLQSAEGQKVRRFVPGDLAKGMKVIRNGGYRHANDGTVLSKVSQQARRRGATRTSATRKTARSAARMIGSANFQLGYCVSLASLSMLVESNSCLRSGSCPSSLGRRLEELLAVAMIHTRYRGR